MAASPRPPGDPARAARSVRGEARVPIEALGVGRRGPGPGAVGAIAAVVVGLLVGGGLLSSTLFPIASPSLGPSGSAAAVAASASSASSASSPAVTGPAVPAAEAPSDSPALLPDLPPITPRPALLAVDTARLAAGMRDGSYADMVVLVAGRLHSAPRFCSAAAPLSACIALRVDGLDGVTVVADDNRGAWQGDPSPGAVLVLRVAQRSLVYLGSVVLAGGIPGTAYLSGLLLVPGWNLAPPADLLEADGILFRNDDAACFGSVTSCGRPAPYIVPAQTSSSGAISYGEPIGVALAPVVAGMNPADIWTTGPFFLRQAGPASCSAAVGCPGAVWEVVAREAPGGVVSIVLP